MEMDFLNKVKILSDLWINYRDDDDFDDFMQYNDLGLPLAYLINTELAAVTDQGRIYIEETYNLLCAALDIDLNGEYNSLIDMFNKSEEG
jgi:hypothetical protein